MYPGVENWGYVARDFLRQFMLKSSFFKHQALMWLYKSFYAENFLNSLHDFHDRKNLRIISIPCVMSIETFTETNLSWMPLSERKIPLKSSNVMCWLLIWAQFWIFNELFRAFCGVTLIIIKFMNFFFMQGLDSTKYLSCMKSAIKL